MPRLIFWDVYSPQDTELALMAMDSDDDKQHFNIKEIAEYENMSKSKRKRKLKTNKLKDIQDDFKVRAGSRVI